jgi:hypothetical protein
MLTRYLSDVRKSAWLLETKKFFNLLEMITGNAPTLCKALASKGILQMPLPSNVVGHESLG